MKLVLHPAAEAHIAGVLNHAGGSVLLHGSDGMGKRTLALEIARRLNCQGCENESCRACRMIAAGNHPDIILIDPDEKNKIGIGSIQELHHTLTMEPYEPGAKRVIILTEAHSATVAAQNALLKALEEPGKNTTFILTSSNPEAMLPTVLSRCMQIFLPALDRHTMLEFIKTLDASADAEAITELSQGAPGRAWQFVKEPGNLQQRLDIKQQIVDFLSSSSLFDRIKMADGMASKNELRSEYIKEIASYIRKQTRINPAQGYILEAIERLQLRLKANVNPKTAFEALAVEL